MDQEEARQPLSGEARLAAYLDAIAGVLGHARRVAAAQAYCTGLLLPGERKSIEPMAARLARRFRLPYTFFRACPPNDRLTATTKLSGNPGLAAASRTA